MFLRNEKEINFSGNPLGHLKMPIVTGILKKLIHFVR